MREFGRGRPVGRAAPWDFFENAGGLRRSVKRRAKKSLCLATVAEALTAAVSVIQRGDSALRLNVHFHVLALDGVYVREEPDAPLVFHPLAARPPRK